MSAFKALVCLTTCNRDLLLRRYSPHYLAFCRADRAFDFLVALDGQDPSSVSYCLEFGIPLLYSDQREGVGLTKNRVVDRFGAYDYYFFLEDDAELLDARVFREHIRVAAAAGFHHLSLFEGGGAREILRRDSVCGHSVVFAKYGGAQFSFFTRQGLEAVGGWHTAFAEPRRGGHTEHSLRFVHAGLADAPFIVIETLTDCLLWHYPPPVTKRAEAPPGKVLNQLSETEQRLIAQQLTFFPLTTLQPSHFNGMPLDGSRAFRADDVGLERYPRLSSREKRDAWADFFVALAATQSGFRRWLSLLKAACCQPKNTHLRHVLKQAASRAL